MYILTKISISFLILSFFCAGNIFLLAQTPPYTELSTDIVWSPGNLITVGDIAAAFENARTVENAQLGTNLPTTFIMPSQSKWDEMTNSEKALFIINAERVVRGLLPFGAVSSKIVTISQDYADFLLANNVFDHTENGTPTDRLNGDTAINGCEEKGYFYGPECLAAYVQSDGTVPLPVERAVYGWIYVDSGSSWGHRNTCFALFNNDYGSSSDEGFIGVGLATGGPWSGFGDKWPVAAIVVFDFVDPCPTSTLP